jgi:hypothetical protein
VKKIVDRLPVDRHNLGDFFDIGIDIETKINDLLLTFAQTRQRMPHLPRQLRQPLLPDDARLNRRRTGKQGLEMQLLPRTRIPRTADLPRQLPAKRLQQIIFYKGSFTDGLPVDPKLQEEILQAVLDQLLIPREPGTVMKEIGIMHTDKRAECIRIPAAIFVPQKEIFTQQINSAHSNRKFWSGSKSSKKLRFRCYPLLEKFFNYKAGSKTRRHPQQIAPDIRPPDQLAEKIPDQVGRLEPIRDLRHLPPHMLLIDIVLVLQVADRFPQFIQISDLAHVGLF